MTLKTLPLVIGLALGMLAVPVTEAQPGGKIARIEVRAAAGNPDAVIP